MTEQKMLQIENVIRSLCPGMPTVSAEIRIRFSSVATGGDTRGKLIHYIRAVVDTLYYLGHENDAKSMHDFLMLVRREVI